MGQPGATAQEYSELQVACNDHFDSSTSVSLSSSTCSPSLKLQVDKPSVPAAMQVSLIWDQPESTSTKTYTGTPGQCTATAPLALAPLALAVTLAVTLRLAKAVNAASGSGDGGSSCVSVLQVLKFVCQLES